MISLSHRHFHKLPPASQDGGRNSKFRRIRNLLLPKFKLRVLPSLRRGARKVKPSSKSCKRSCSRYLVVTRFLTIRKTHSGPPHPPSTAVMTDSPPPPLPPTHGGGLAGGGPHSPETLALVELLQLSDPPEDKGPWRIVSGDAHDLDSGQTLDPAGLARPEIGASLSRGGFSGGDGGDGVVDFKSAFTSSSGKESAAAAMEAQPSDGEAVIGVSSAAPSGELGSDDDWGDYQGPGSPMETEAGTSAPSSPNAKLSDGELDRDEGDSEYFNQPPLVVHAQRSGFGGDGFHCRGCPARNGYGLWCQCSPRLDRGRSDSEDEDDRRRDFFCPRRKEDRPMGYFWSRREPVPTGMGAGLANLGNTCFINAILQCFTHTVPLVKALRSHNHSLPCDRGTDGFCVLDALRDHIERSLTSSGETIAPRKLFENLSCILCCLRYASWLCYMVLLDDLIKQALNYPFDVSVGRLERCCLDPNPAEGSSSSEADNIVQQIFGGRLVSKLKCCSCGHFSDKYEPLIDLSLEIEDVDSLHDALESFTKVEKIEDPETKLSCDSCKEKVTMEKQLMLDRAPLITTLHLKRFKTDGHSVEKIGKHVEFPLELDLAPYSSDDQNDNEGLKYQLYGVVVHNGFSPTSGHYFCYIKSSPGKWHKLDDSRVTECREEFVLSQVAYLLLYAREGTPWFSSLMDSQKVNRELGSSSTSPKSVLQTMEVEYTSSDNNSKENGDHCDAAASVLTGDEAVILEPKIDSPREPVVQDKQVEILEQNDGKGLEEGPSFCDDETKGAAKPSSSPPPAAADDILQATREPQDYGTFNDQNLRPQLLANPSGSGPTCEKSVRDDDGGRLFQSQIPFTHSGRATNSVRLPETRYRNPRDQQCKAGNLVAEERLSRKGGKDPQTSEAVRYMNKTMSSSRRNQLMAAIDLPNEAKKGGLRTTMCSSKRSRSADPSRRVLRRTEAMR
ncbi:unnamed protein product [Linum tenue]|uniref:Ubiquitin carboxyl-terminal hydrolase n=1 Tax=Linum tenue TaxID=586396 RepID=A0AAV0HCY2_9ROSI|nr:unnamed protein product [Linum tenue]